MAEFGDDIDVRTDIPRYRIFRNGIFEEETTNISIQTVMEFNGVVDEIQFMPNEPPLRTF